MQTGVAEDGILTMVPRERMSPAVRKMWDTYQRMPGAPFYQREFGFYSLERWAAEGMPQDVPVAQLFGFDAPARHSLGQLGWCDAAFQPAFEVKVLEDRGEYEVEQDNAGRQVLFFKGRRSGFMPTYLAHPVKDLRTWEENARWRLDSATPARYANLEERMARARMAAAAGMEVVEFGAWDVIAREVLQDGDELAA